jgi:hypothetical protein
MNAEPKKSRRRRRRPRSSAKNRAKSSAKPPAKSPEKPSSSAAKTASGSGRRGRSRRRNSGAAAKAKKQSQDALTIQQHTEKAISPINKDIFIYTYTLRPRSLLDSYEAGPNVAEKMAYEQPEEQPLTD